MFAQNSQPLQQLGSGFDLSEGKRVSFFVLEL